MFKILNVTVLHKTLNVFPLLSTNMYSALVVANDIQRVALQAEQSGNSTEEGKQTVIHTRLTHFYSSTITL